MCGVLLNLSSCDVAGQRRLRGIPQGTHERGGEGHCSRGDLTHGLTHSPTHSITHSLNHTLTLISLRCRSTPCRESRIVITSFHLPSSCSLTLSLTHSLCPSEQCMPSRVRARFCTGVACHVSPHNMLHRMHHFNITICITTCT